MLDPKIPPLKFQTLKNFDSPFLKEKEKNQMREKEAPVSFEQFKASIRTIKKENEYMGKCSELGLYIFKNLHCEYALVKLLDSLFGGYDKVGWWFYEKDYGSRADLDVTINGTVVPTETVEDLYKLVCDMHEYECVIDICKKEE